MAEETRKKYRALKAVAVSGIVDIGGIVELTEAEAENIGIGTYLEEVVGDAPGLESGSAPKDGEGSEKKDPDENGSAQAGDGGENKSGE